MTMRITFKFYPNGDEEAQRAKSALEQVKTDILAPRGAYVDGLAVSEVEEDVPYGSGPLEGQSYKAKVVKIDGWVHIDK